MAVRALLNLKFGCAVPHPEQLLEGCERRGNRLTANVSADKTGSVMRHFIRMHKELLFFILELPTDLSDETDADGGKSVYYVDGLTQAAALTIVRDLGELLIHDGLCAFGFGGHDSGDEILFGSYNVMTVYSDNIDKFRNFFSEHGIRTVETLVTAWDTFTDDAPGSAEAITINGKTVFDIPALLEDWGIYPAGG